MPAHCYSWSATSEAGPMAGAVWFWLRSSRQQQCQSGREERACLQRCGWPSGQLSQEQYCSGPQGGLYPAFWWSYLVSSSCCLLVIQLESHTSKPVTVPSRFLLSLNVSHTLSTRLQDKQTSKPLLTSTFVYRWTPAIQCNICFSFSLYCVFSSYLITNVRCENSVRQIFQLE